MGPTDAIGSRTRREALRVAPRKGIGGDVRSETTLWGISATLLMALACGGEPGVGSIAGTWHVRMKLVAALAAGKTDSEPWRVRNETWRILQGPAGLLLNSPVWCLPGRAAAGGWVFENAGDTAFEFRTHVKARMQADGSLAGKIKLQYVGTFNDFLRDSAWTFTAVRQ